MSSDEDEVTTHMARTQITGKEETTFFSAIEKKRKANAQFRSFAERDTTRYLKFFEIFIT